MAALPMLAEGALLGGRYRIVRELGRGGMGVVYEAVQQDLNRRVALKVLLAFGGGPALERFRREAQSAAALGHPSIVQVTDFQTPGDGPPFLVMELLDGISLGALIDRDGPVPYPRVAFIITQVLSALAVAHQAGIIHRDIKPDNVFLTATSVADDLVKVLDFGVAKVETESAPMTAFGQVIGTPAYMPPEQARGGVIDARADVFAVGATMYHAITGQLPTPPTDEHAATAEAPVSRSIMVGAALSLIRPDLPTGLTALVDRAMSLDPRERFASADEMRAAVWAWLPQTSSSRMQTAASQAPTTSSSPMSAAPMSAGLPSYVNAPTVAPYTVGAPTIHRQAAQQTAMQPTMSQPPSFYAPMMTQAPPPPSKTNLFLLLGLVSALFVILLIVGGAAMFLLGRDTSVGHHRSRGHHSGSAPTGARSRRDAGVASDSAGVSPLAPPRISPLAGDSRVSSDSTAYPCWRARSVQERTSQQAGPLTEARELQRTFPKSGSAAGAG